MEIILKWKETKSPGFPGSLSNHICLSQRRDSSNWGTHFLTLLKSHLLFRQCKHCISFHDCGAFFPFNNQGQCLEFIYVILVYLKPFSDLGFLVEFIFFANILFEITEQILYLLLGTRQLSFDIFPFLLTLPINSFDFSWIKRSKYSQCIDFIGSNLVYLLDCVYIWRYMGSS